MNQYDTDVTVWSPQGRLHQVEYAGEAVKQGSVCVGARSKTTVVLAALKRSPNELASYQRKVVKVDSHMGIAIAGLTADGRSLAKYLRSECLHNKYVFGASVQTSRLLTDVADMHQKCTQSYVRRPYGVGLLVASYDQTGPHLFNTEPSGEYNEFFAASIGSRSQAARTYLERNLDSFPDASDDDLILHVLRALTSTLQGDKDLTTSNTTIAIVSKDKEFTILEGLASGFESSDIETKSRQVNERNLIQVYLDRLEVTTRGQMVQETVGAEEPVVDVSTSQSA